MAYVAVVKALYDYAAQDPETELAFKEDQIIYVIEKEDDDWWKGKLKEEVGGDGAVGLIPATYVEELPPLNTTKALYAYDSTSPEELSMQEESTLHVFSIEDDWLLVRLEGGTEHLGFVPRNYCEPLDASEEVEVPDAAEAEAELAAERQRAQDEKLRKMRLQDKVETWSVSEVDGKKKKKGTLGVGNGAVFFASDTDKMTPVKQYPITDLDTVSQPGNKDIQLSFSTLSAPLHLQCSSASEASAVLAKLESSKQAAGEALETVAADARAAPAPDSEEEEPASPVAPAEPRGVRFAPPQAAAAAPAAKGPPKATVLYDFDAQGDDELSVKEDEVVTVVDQENDEWWTVKNTRGEEGVVPAQYLQLQDGTEAAAAGGAGAAAVATGGADELDSDEEREERELQAAEQARAARAAERAAEQEKKRAKEARAAERQRRAIEEAAQQKRDQEEEDHRLALELEQREIEKVRRREAKSREAKERDLESRREQARSREPPKISKRPSTGDVTAAAASLPSRGRHAPERPPENNRPKPHAGKIRTWRDKTGQFEVEAEYLGLNGNKIRLHKINGVIIDVPLDKMSQEDVQMIKRYEARKRQQAQELDDDVPLASSRRERRREERREERSDETRERSRPSREPREEPIPAAAMEMPKARKTKFDWFAFFLEAGCDMDDCTRYAAAFERDRIEEDILPELERGTMRSLGLKEGDVIRVKKAIDLRFRKTNAEESAQIKSDEEYARQLHEYEKSGGKGPMPQPPPSLFTGKDGKLANNTRRGRPEKKGSGADAVDADAIAAAGNQLSKMNTGDSDRASPPPEKQAQKPAPLITGFDDDAWTIKPSSSKPASPAPGAPTAPPMPPPVSTNPPIANTTESLLAQIQSLRPSSTGGMQANNTGGTFDRLSQMTGSPQSGPSGFANAQAYGLGAQNTGTSMNQLIQNGPRGPIAPVAQNESLLNPLQPARTGFVPTRGGSPGGFNQPQPAAFAPSPTGFAQQPTGFQPQQQQQVYPQTTGYAQGFQQGYGGFQQQVQPNFTGFQQQPQQQQGSFNAIANLPPPQQQQNPDKFAPSNIFAAMKQQDFGKPEEQRPQDANKYDALRPLTTGYNGAPGMLPQQTGFGMMPQMTGYNPYAQQPQGYGYH